MELEIYVEIWKNRLTLVIAFYICTLKFHQNLRMFERKKALLTVLSTDDRLYMCTSFLTAKDMGMSATLLILDRKLGLPESEHFLYWQLVCPTHACFIVQGAGSLFGWARKNAMFPAWFPPVLLSWNSET